MSESANILITRIENQLAQLILYIGSVDALAEEYRASMDSQKDAFLFGTVYDALWEAAIVKIAALWDTRRGVASLPKLAEQLKLLPNSQAKSVARRIRTGKSSQLDRLLVWRHQIVAHLKFPIDPATFDEEFSIGIEDLRAESERAESIVADARRALGHEPTFFDVLKSDAIRDAKMSLLSRGSSRSA